MTFEIDLNPHSFVAFMTIAAGVSYIFFNSPNRFGVVKLMTLLFFIVPSVIIGNSLGHSVDLVVGALVGFLTARRVSWFNPYTRIKNHFSLLNAINRLNDKFNEQEQKAKPHSEDRSAHEEAQRRQEQAQRERERAKQNKSDSNKSSGYKSSNQSKKKSSSSEGYNQSYQGAKPKRPSKRADALAVLGLEPTATMQEAKRARSELLMFYHPDRLAKLKPGPQKKAEEEAKKINVAWDYLKKSK